MAFAPAGPEASFFEVLDRHRASLLAALRRDGGEPAGGGTRQATGSEVLASIEHIIQEVIASLARNKAPAFTVDNRSSWENIKFEDSVGLQMVSHCTMRKIRSDSTKSIKKFALILKILSMIYKLAQSNTYATKRDIYYTDSQLFGNQTVVDNIINDISCMLKVPRRSLHILSTSKGLLAGSLRYLEEDGTKVNCPCGATAVAVPSNVQGIRNLITDAKFLLIVEKDATFQRLLDDNFCNKMSPCIMVTERIKVLTPPVCSCDQGPATPHVERLHLVLCQLGESLDNLMRQVLSSPHFNKRRRGCRKGKGVPDLNTRLLVKKLWDTFHIPVFTLVDADPHGIEIMCIYKYGSMSMSFEAHHLTVPAVRWLGLLPSDIKRLNISKETLIPLTKQDQMKLDSILKRPYVTCQPFWRKEMEIMADSKMKAEIQALTCLSSDYLSRVYLPNKLKFGGWI
ncbi:meiotic recombination protein SPO11 isoform X1 [Talpa occidentalis]|uniref:meiotic recombination protein SPO11 isoform X1 n=1 Tax=Talpa occidentalis TaxID=50954 RepID=UPI0023F9201D|nr:meiotic recombination protein SPO11 isoform X1 [Talpa occidentalis]